MVISPLLAGLDQNDSIRYMHVFDLLKSVHVKAIRELKQLREGLCHTQISNCDERLLRLDDAVNGLAHSQVANHAVLAQNKQRNVARLCQL